MRRRKFKFRGRRKMRGRRRARKLRYIRIGRGGTRI